MRSEAGRSWGACCLVSVHGVCILRQWEPRVTPKGHVITRAACVAVAPGEDFDGRSTILCAFTHLPEIKGPARACFWYERSRVRDVVQLDCHGQRLRCRSNCAGNPCELRWYVISPTESARKI